MALLAVSCRAPTENNDTIAQPAASPSATTEKVSCAIGGEAGFAPVCTIDRASGADGIDLTLRHPDGGFRRLRMTADGGIVAADGSEPAVVTTTGDRIEVKIGDDRYRLPAAAQGKR